MLQAYRAGSISRRRREVGIAQQVASAHVRSLETALGRMLIEAALEGALGHPRVAHVRDWLIQ